MATKNWKIADLPKIQKLAEDKSSGKMDNALKALKKSASEAKKSVGELDKVIKDEPDL